MVRYAEKLNLASFCTLKCVNIKELSCQILVALQEHLSEKDQGICPVDDFWLNG